MSLAPMQGETRVMLFSVILAAAKLKKAMLRARAAKQREARQAEKKAAEQAALEQQATAHGWDPEQLDMLRQSYMEVAGSRPHPASPIARLRAPRPRLSKYIAAASP